MNKEKFWKIVEFAKKESEGTEEKYIEIMELELNKLTPKEIIGFDEILDGLRVEAYDRELWGAAYVINGGCSDDGFEYFRAWLIAQGQIVYENALKDPKTLESSIVMDSSWDAEFEEFLYVAQRCYREKTGFEMPERPYLHCQLKGQNWDEDSVYILFSSLYEKSESRFGND
jgi:hypothetical protein